MLSNGTLKESERSASPESELDEQGSPDTANEEEAKQSSEDRLLQSFRRRLVLRRKLSSIISKISPAARYVFSSKKTAYLLYMRTQLIHHCSSQVLYGARLRFSLGHGPISAIASF